MTPLSIWVGFDPREASAFAVARESIKAGMASRAVPVRGVVLDDLRRAGLYHRPMERRDGRLWDVISAAPCSTEFALSRFLVPHLVGRGWALFLDCDVLVRGDLAHLLASLDPKYAAYCVKHEYEAKRGAKMDGQVQTAYPRKNWSSVLAFNCDHPANRALTLDVINTARGLDLHKLTWLADCDIGELPGEWNWLVGEQPAPTDPKVVHYTLGGPWLPEFTDAPYADEWRMNLNRWAA